MLRALSVRDVVLIERLELPVGAGLTVLTGETGAGKSILLDSLGLALGERAGAGLVRAGAAEASATATFELAPDHPAWDVLAEAGIPPEDEALVLRRSVSRDGRSRAYVNDQPVGVALLRRAGALLVEIQGQHEQMGLADPATHGRLLDTFGVPPARTDAVRTTHRAWSDSAQRLAAAEAALAEAAREEEWLRESESELARLAPMPDEETRLAERRIALQQGERRREAIDAALAELAPTDRRRQGPGAGLRAGARALARIGPAASPAGPDAPEDPAQALAAEAAAAIERAEIALAEAETLLSRLAADADDDPRALNEAEERLFALRAAARKFAVPVSELAPLLATWRARLEALDQGSTGLAQLREAETAERRAFDTACEALGIARATAATALEAAIARELAPLKLDRARFVVALQTVPPAQRSELGGERAAFLIAANPGQPPGPLGRVASGGELSRLMLALKVVLSESSPVGTLVFDEVDSGIGGATASAVGERLARVARTRQVLVVTHSPQVAARGAAHLTVEKHVARGQTTTAVSVLDAARRREEIARMLAGETVTDAARQAASSLLERLL